jgi:uncharacterized protein YbaR (Trm112 family)
MTDTVVAEPLLGILVCPDCHTALEPTPSTVAGYGVLSCAAHHYPVVAGIPIIRSGQISPAGPTVDDLLATIRGQDPVAALVDLLAFPPGLPLGLDRVPGLRLPLTRGPGNRALTNTRRSDVRRRIEQPVERQSAQDWLELRFRHSRGADSELYSQYLHRFSQPRYLASLALAEVLPTDGRPLLDLACGFAHLLHHLGVRSPPVPAVGVDRDFFALWVARNWIAPQAWFVCADPSEPLPFTDGAFGSARCGLHQTEVVAELRRCATGPVVLDRVGNALEDPQSPTELDPAGYAALAGSTPYRMLSERELVAGYLAGHGPQLAQSRPSADFAEFAEEKWLSLVISDDPAVFVDHGPFPRPPHAEGTVRLNPIYQVEPTEDGVHLRFDFPSTRYAVEHAGMLNYHAPGTQLPLDRFRSLRRLHPDSALIRRFVQLSLPDHYLSDSHR